MAVGLKRKRVSKKTKKSWRKNVDVTDVDAFLEDQRLEERLGGKAELKPDKDLFEIDEIGADSTPPDAATSKTIYHANDVGLGAVKRSLRVRETDTPKCFALLDRRSAVPDPVGRRTGVKSREERLNPIARKILEAKREKGVLTAKEKDAVKRRKEDDERRKKEKEKSEFNRVVWDDKNDDRDMEGHGYWLSNDTIRHNLHNTGKRKKKTPIPILKKPSVVPAVEAPHPGASYNPSAKDHQELLTAIAEKEAVLVKEEQHLYRVTTKMFSKAKRGDIEKEWMTEMSVGLKQMSDESEAEGDYTTVNPPAKNKKKTLKKRRKLREAIELKEKLRQAKVEKKKVSDLYRLRQLDDALKKKDKKEQLAAEKRKILKEKKIPQTKMLSQTKFIAPEQEFCMVQELTGNLRGMEPQGNLLVDRYKSMQKRNILEPAIRRRVKKRPTKKYEKKSAKMGWEPKGY